MNLHEYQAKELLRKYGVKTPAGIMANTVGEAVEAAKIVMAQTGNDAVVIKAQIHAGGRGKGGGIKFARTLDEVREKAGAILGMQLVTPQTSAAGKKVNKVLIQGEAYIDGPFKQKELYVSMLLNRNISRNIIMYSTEGGMEIEEIAEKTPHLIFTEVIDPYLGLQDYQCRKIAFDLKLEGKAFNEMVNFLKGLYKTYMAIDAALVEVNPLLKNAEDEIIAVDAKVRLDGNALFKHPDLEALRDILEEDPTDVEAGNNKLNYVRLDGNVGCMVNGAGLAMATMDIIKLAGAEPANFLDVGGTANAERIEKAFQIILKDPTVKAIFINIFGGIVLGDERVARVDHRHALEVDVGLAELRADVVHVVGHAPEDRLDHRLLAVAAQVLVAMQLLDPLEVDDRHHADQQVDVATDVDAVILADVGAVQPLVEQQVAVGRHRRPRREGAGLATELRGLGVVVDVAPYLAAPRFCVLAERRRELRQQVRLRAEVADLRPLALVRRLDASAHLDPVEAMEGVALDDLGLESFAAEDVREALHDGGRAGARGAGDRDDGMFRRHDDLVRARQLRASGRNRDRSLNSGETNSAS